MGRQSVDEALDQVFREFLAKGWVRLLPSSAMQVIGAAAILEAEGRPGSLEDAEPFGRPGDLVTSIWDHDPGDPLLADEDFRSWLEEREALLARMAAHVGIPAPVCVGNLAELMCRLGLVQRDGIGPVSRWRTPDGGQTTLRTHAGPHGEFDWYAFDQVGGTQPKDELAPESLGFSFLPVPVSFSGMPNARWWNFEDGRFNWANVDTDRRDLAKVMVVDFMLVQGNDWFMVPFGQEVGTLVRVDQLLVRDVFGEWTLVGRADADPGVGRTRWTMFSTDSAEAKTGLADWFVLPPSALRATLDGPDLEEVRFVRDEQANMAWAVEAVTEDGTGRPWSGRERALEVPEGAPPIPEPIASLRYRLQTAVPVNWIPFVPVQVDAARRAVALERGAMQRFVDGVLTAVAPAGRVLRPTGLADPDVYRVQEEEVARTGTRILRAARRTRWIDGSTYWWTSRLRRAGMGEAASGLKYDVAERTDQTGG
jgi:hypothetical protein